MQEIILEFLFGPANINKGLAPLAIAGIAQGVSSLFGALSAGKQKREARKAAEQYEKDLSRLEASRQSIENLDFSSIITNPYANLQVATQAAEFGAAETDISLASTLDTLRATGAGAGGATALAQAAARSKQGIAASIEQQEAQNAQLRAQGEQQMQRMLIGTEQYKFGVQEERELLQLERVQGLSEQQRAFGAQARQAQSGAISSLIGSAASIGLSAFGGPKVPKVPTPQTAGVVLPPPAQIQASGYMASDLTNRKP